MLLAFSSSGDRGIRLFLLNHTPDELVVVNAQNGSVEKRQAIADGLRKLVFSSDGNYAYISNAVDVTNKVTVLDANTFLKSEVIEVDGIPQDLAIFPDNRRLAVVNGAKTDFQASGFDVIDLKEKSPSNPRRKMVLFRARDMRLVDRIAVDKLTGLVFAIDTKSSNISVFDVDERKLVKQIDLGASPISMLFPEASPYFFVSSIRRESVFVIDRATLEIVKRIRVGRCRQIASDREGKMLYVPLAESKQIAVADVNKGFVVKYIGIPYRCEVIEMSPFDDQLFLVDTSLEGTLFAVDLKTDKIVWERNLTGEFRDIEVRPFGG